MRWQFCWVRTTRRRTKIIATLGPATDPEGVLDRLIEAGLDCARLNCSHGTPQELRRRTAAVRAAEARARRPIAVLFDLQGPKIRLGSSFNPREVAVGERVTLVVGEEPIEGEVPVAYPQFIELLSEESEIVIGDGTPRLKVTEIDSKRIRTEVTQPGPLKPRKGANVTYARPMAPAMTEKDYADLDVAVDCEADFVALSFVRSAADVELLRAALSERGSHARVIAKIEKVEAYEALDEIIAAADGIMVARGDYGVEAGAAAVPLMQKDAIERAGKAGKLVITATHMLESMTSAAVPTRAEATDVANAVLDGTSCVMLSAETATGDYPVDAVRTMSEIARAAERDESIYCLWLDEEDLQENPATAVMHAAVGLGRDVDSEVIIVPTSSGGSVRAAAKYRPKRPIVGLAHNRQVARQLTLEWGVYPGMIDVVEDIEDLVDAGLEAALSVLPELSRGELAVISAGPLSGRPGQTNLITLRPLPGGDDD